MTSIEKMSSIASEVLKPSEVCDSKRLNDLHAANTHCTIES